MPVLFRRTPRNQHSLKDGLLTITCIEPKIAAARCDFDWQLRTTFGMPGQEDRPFRSVSTASACAMPSKVNRLGELKTCRMAFVTQSRVVFEI